MVESQQMGINYSILLKVSRILMLTNEIINVILLFIYLFIYELVQNRHLLRVYGYKIHSTNK